MNINSDYEKIVRFWQNKKITNSNELETALNDYVVLFAYHSGKIENNNITYNDTREIFDHDGVSSYTGDLRTLFEIRNAKDASDFILDAFEHQMPGEFKKHDYVTGRYETGATPADVKDEISELLGELSEMRFKDNNQILTAASYFHAKFENIHPFSDGNGRTGRLAMNYFLLSQNTPPIVFHEEDRKLYYQSLEKWDTLQNLRPIKLFLQIQAIKTWQKIANRENKFSR